MEMRQPTFELIIKISPIEPAVPEEDANRELANRSKQKNE